MDKMPYYEPPYPEETHYSHVLRLAKLNGFDSFLPFADYYLTFNGFSEGVNLRDSAANMAPFFAAADMKEPYSKYILDTTPYSFHSKFLDDCRKHKYLNRMYQIDNRFLYQVLMDKQKICYCCDCMKEGAYFRQIHQIPGVNICPKHGTPLLVCQNKKFHEYDGLLIGDQIDGIKSIQVEYELSLFIYLLSMSDADIASSDIRNIILSNVGDLSKYDEFATQLIASKYGIFFKNANDVYNFLRTQIKKSRISEIKAIAILLYLFGDYEHFIAHYDEHKNEYGRDDIDEDEFQSFLQNENYSLVSNFDHNIITVRHNTCGRLFVTTPRMLMDGWLCPFCGRSLSNSDFQKRLVEYTGHGDYKFIKAADGLTDRITMFHERCGQEITQRLDEFLFWGYRCPCRNKMLYSDAEAIIQENNFQLIRFTNVREPVEIKCNKCGKIHKYNDFTFAHKSIKCRNCEAPVGDNKEQKDGTQKILDGMATHYRRDINHVKNEIYNLVGDEYSVLDFGKINSTGKYSVKVRHADCGEEYWTSYQGFLHGSRCQCEGHGVQASTEELKRYIHDLSCGEYVCIDDEITDRNHVRIQNAGTGEMIDLPYKMILQELKRITPSSILPCDNVNRNAIRPRSAPMLFMEYLRDTYGDDGVFFSRDFVYDAPKAWITSTLNMFLQQGLIKRIGTEIYSFSDVEPDWNKIANLFYIGQNNTRYGCTYGRSFLQDLGISMEHPPVYPHIMSNRKGRMNSAKPSQRKEALIRNIGPVAIRVKKAPCEITAENYKALQVADYLNSHHNQNYPYLNEKEMALMATYLKESPASAVYDVIKLYPENVKLKMISMYEE